MTLKLQEVANFGMLFHVIQTFYALVLSPNLKESSAWNELYCHLLCTWYLFSFNILWNSKIYTVQFVARNLLYDKIAYDKKKSCSILKPYDNHSLKSVMTVTCDKIVPCQSATGACSKFVKVYMLVLNFNESIVWSELDQCIFWTSKNNTTIGSYITTNLS